MYVLHILGKAYASLFHISYRILLRTWGIIKDHVYARKPPDVNHLKLLTFGPLCIIKFNKKKHLFCSCIYILEKKPTKENFMMM